MATVAVYVATLLLFFLVVASGLPTAGGGGFVFGRRVAIVELEGVIIDVDEVVRELRAYRDNPAVRAVVIRINSPGGVVGPSQELHDAVERLREAGKPVVASLGAVAASGGYYVAVAADRIYANPGTLTGSIGVIMQLPNIEGLLKKVGVDYVVIKAGEFKDAGNFARPMSSDERRVLQALLDDVHEQFILAVAEGRNLDPGDVAKFADGRIFSGAQAKDMNMVDELGGLEEAVNGAAQLAGLPVPPLVITPPRRFSVFELLSSKLGLPGVLARPAALPIFKTPLYLMD